MSKDEVANYLDSFLLPNSLEKQRGWPRVKCCGTSRSIYCSECYSLLIPPHEWPTCARRLPFNLHIILHDRRSAATGLHAKVIDTNFDFQDPSSDREVLVFDLERLEPLPLEYPEHSYILFPCEDSIPLESVRDKVQTLVVLDCKWTRASSRHDPRLKQLPRVHLTHPPDISHYWRWHSAGTQCLSTIEAIYEAACEVKPHDNYNINRSNASWLPWLWLFGLQRAATGGISQNNKLEQKERRRQKGTEKQRRDKERGKTLSEQHKMARESRTKSKEARKPQWQIHLEAVQANANGSGW